jgi:hypothetical protein
MGLWHGVIKDLIELKQSGYIGPGCRIAEIGEQQLSDDFPTADDLLGELYATFGRVPCEIGKPVGTENFATAAPPSAPFWRSLGFGYCAFDIAGKEAIRLDLNRESRSVAPSAQF